MRRASKINSAPGISENIVEPGKFLVIPGMNFSCSGSIVGFFVGAEARDLSQGHVARFDLWRPQFQSGKITSYSKVYDEPLYTAVRPGQFTADGLFKLNIAGAAIFEEGDVLGVYQSSSSRSSVRIFYTTQSRSSPIAFNPVNFKYSSTSTISSSGHGLFKGTILVRPFTGMYSLLYQPLLPRVDRMPLLFLRRARPTVHTGTYFQRYTYF